MFKIKNVSILCLITLKNFGLGGTLQKLVVMW